MKALVVVSFGSSYPEAIETLDGVAKYIHSHNMEKTDLFTAFTSSFIRKKLLGQGIEVNSLEEVLTKLKAEGYKEVQVQPTHIIPGQEYEKLVATAEAWKNEFGLLTMGKPLIHDAKSLLNLAETLQRLYQEGLEHSLVSDEALLFMGHGTNHLSNFIYPALQTAFRTNDFSQGFVATVEGWPELADAIKLMKEAGCKKVHMAPMLLIAGEHVLKDMIGDEPNSWKNVLSDEGFDVSYSTNGLASFTEILDLYITNN